MNTFLPAVPFVGFSVPEALPASRCASLLRELVARGFSATGLHYPRDYRNNDRLVFDDAPLAQELYASLRGVLPQELVRDDGVWRLAGFNSRFRACRYQGGQGFCVHRDGAYVPRDGLRSMLTVQFYLDDAPERFGGHTRFYADARGTTLWASIPPVAGTAIVFDHQVWHDGEAVSSGVKHVIRTDAMYERVSAAACPKDRRRVIGRHRGYAWRAIARADGEIASAGRDGTVRTWGNETVAPRVTQLGLGSVTALHEVSGVLWAGTRSGALVRVDGSAAAHPVANVPGAVLSLAHLATNQGDAIVAATASGSLFAFDETGATIWTAKAHESWAWSVTPYRDGVVSVGHDGRVCFTNQQGQTSLRADLQVPLRSVAARAGSLCAGSLSAESLCAESIWVGDALGNLYRLVPGRAPCVVMAHEAAITSLTLARDGTLFSASEDGSVKRWRGGVSSQCGRSPDFVTSVMASDSDTVVCAGYDGVIWTVR